MSPEEISSELVSFIFQHPQLLIAMTFEGGRSERPLKRKGTIFQQRGYLLDDLLRRGVREEVPAGDSAGLHGVAAIEPSRGQVVEFCHGARCSVKDERERIRVHLIRQVVGKIDGQSRAIVVAATGNCTNIVP